MNATVDEDLCIGCAVCEQEFPEIFRLEADGLAHVIAKDMDPEVYGDVRAAADLCPVDAIEISS